MALIPYKNPGDSLSHNDWDAMVAEADRKLALNYGGLAIGFWGDPPGGFGGPVTVRYDRRFYFYPDSFDPSAPPKTASEAFWQLETFKQGQTSRPGQLRNYKHGIFQQIVNALQPAVFDPNVDGRVVKNAAYPCVRLVVQDWNAFIAQFDPLVFPPSGNQYFPAALSDPLYYSLEAHQKLIHDDDGIDRLYNVYIDTTPRPEYGRSWMGVEIYLGALSGGALSFPDNYNKYNFFRFNNLTEQLVSVDFGGHHTLNVPPMASKCIRRTAVNGSYTEGYNYFQKPLAGDPWFLQWDPFGSQEYLRNGITDMAAVQYLVGTMYTQMSDGSLSQIGKLRDYRQFWRCESIYCDASKAGLPNKYGPVMPAGAWVGPLPVGGTGEGSAVKLGDIFFHKGKLCVVNPAGNLRVTRSPAQQFTVVADASTKYVLTKADGSTALGVEDLTELVNVTKGTTVPLGTDWDYQNEKGDAGDILDWYITIVAGNGAFDVGDVVRATFTHLLDDQKLVVAFTGMDGLGAALAVAGIGLVQGQGPLGKSCELRSSPAKDVLGLSSNLVWACAGAHAATCGAGTPGSLGFDLGYLGVFNLLGLLELGTETLNEHVDYIAWDGFDPSTYNYTNPHSVTVNWTRKRRTCQVMPSFFFSYFETVGDVIDALQNRGGDMDTTAELWMTAFGPKIYFEQTIPIDFPAGTGPAGSGEFSFQEGGIWFELKQTNTGPVWFRRGTISLGRFGRVDGGVSWPVHADAASGPQEGIAPVEVGQFAWNYPRFWRYWQNLRYAYHAKSDEPFWTDPGTLAPYPTRERPLVKSYYESKPFNEWALLPVASGPMMAKTGIALAGPRDGDFDVLTRLGYWVAEQVFVFLAPQGFGPNHDGLLTTDYTHGHPQQVGYYGGTFAGVAQRTRLLTNAPVTDFPNDGAAVSRNAQPISVESYNGAASVINSITAGQGGNKFFPDAAALLNILPNGVGQGFGSLNVRPHDMFTWWDAALYPELQGQLEALGVGVNNGEVDGPWPGVWGQLFARNMLWAIWDDGGGGANEADAPVLSEIPAPGADPSNLYETYFSSLFARCPDGAVRDLEELQDWLANNYRWIRVDGAKAYYASMGIPFIWEELSVPLEFLVSDGSFSLVDHSALGSGATTHVPARLAAFVNNDAGSWVGDLGPFLSEDGKVIIRQEIEPRRHAQWMFGGNTGLALWKADFGEVEKQNFNATGVGIGPTQLLPGNVFYRYRRYGAAAAKAVMFGRMYADYESFWENSIERFGGPPGTNGWQHIPRTVLGSPVSVAQDLPLEENTIAGSLANAELLIVRQGEAF